MAYHEIRVRPVVRYVVTEFKSDADERSGSSAAITECDNVENANRIATQLGWAIENTPRHAPIPHNPVVVVTARALKIDGKRKPGTLDVTEWHLHEEYPNVDATKTYCPGAEPPTPCTAPLMTLERANALLTAWGINKRIVRRTVPRELGADPGPHLIVADPGEAGLWVALASVGIHRLAASLEVSSASQRGGVLGVG